MDLVRIGFLTAAMEALAAAIGAGMLIGGFVAGGVGTMLGWRRSKLDDKVLNAGYVGGAIALMLAVIDSI